MNEILEILSDELYEAHRENEELYDRVVDAEAEVRFLQEELDNANEILDGIEEILINELDTETAYIIYDKIFHIE